MENRSVQTVLVVEDSKMFAHAISTKIKKELGFDTCFATSFREVRHILTTRDTEFFAAILDLVLPDAHHGEAVEFVIERNIPAIILTSEFSDDIRDHFASRDIVDYIIKEGEHSLDQMIATLHRLHKNQSTTVMVVDDSSFIRNTIAKLLVRQRLTVLEAVNGKDALAKLEKNPDIKVIITDYNMPVMDGFDLTLEIRKTHPVGQLAIIGISAHGGSALSAKFIKKGANDFLIKPFSNEEFFWRINQNLQILDLVETIRDAAIKDDLTGLFNRRYFFDVGHKLFESAKRSNASITVAMIDIDCFKRINDTYGHACGDLILSHTARMIEESFRVSDIVARYGGEEFCVLAPNMDPRHSHRIFDQLRQQVAQKLFSYQGAEVRATVSIGLTTVVQETLDQMLRAADENLYEAKRQGRDRTIGDGPTA